MRKHSKAFLALLLVGTMLMGMLQLPLTAFAADEGAAKDLFTLNQVPGGTQKDAIVNGEPRTIYCMQYDYLWPSMSEENHNPPTKYWEASEAELLLTEPQVQVIQRVLYAGYPYDSIGALAPLYNSMGSFAADTASDLTQHAIWSLMAGWGISGNTHYVPGSHSGSVDVPGWDEAYAALMDFALSDAQIPEAPSAFVPAVTGDTTFAEQDGIWVTGALTITNPGDFTVQYYVSLPDGVSPFHMDDEPFIPDMDFTSEGPVIKGYLIYGGEPFYLAAMDVDSAVDGIVNVGGSIKLPTDIRQYSTNETGLGNKDDGQGYIQHRFQTMLSVGISTTDYSASAHLYAPGSEPAVGDLTVSKTVDGNAADTGKAFSFTVTLSDATISGVYGDMTFTDGVATFTLKHGESKTATGLSNGITYTVTEDDYSSDGYSVTATGATGTISETTAAVASFVNSKSISLPVEVPNTGDSTNLTLWILLLAVSFVGLAGTLAYELKSRKAE